MSEQGTTNKSDERLEQIYALVANEEDARSCRDLDEDACHWVPRNFFVYLAANALTKLGDALSNPKTVLAWVMDATGAPAAMIALLVPIRESGSMLPQLVLGAWVRARPMRKPVWIVGALLQAAFIGGCALAAARLSGWLAGATILGCLIGFSLARSMNSVSSKDIVGKTIPKGRRGRLGGWASGISGLAVLAVGVAFALQPPGQGDEALLVALLAGAASLWVLAVLVFSRLEEYPQYRHCKVVLREYHTCALGHSTLQRLTGDFQGAEDSLQYAASLTGENNFWQLLSSGLLATQLDQLESAGQYLDEAATIFPQDYGLLRGKLQLSLASGKLNEFLETIENLSANRAPDRTLGLIGGLAYFHADECSRALESYSRLRSRQAVRMG